MKDLKQIISDLEPYFDFVFENHGSFLETFCQARAWMLIDLSFGQEYVNFVYILDSGQHISDIVSVDDFMVWKNNLLEGA